MQVTKAWGTTALAAAAGVLVLSAAAGQAGVLGGPGNGSEPVAADPGNVSSKPPTAGKPDAGPRPEIVKPRPGMANVSAISWDRAQVRSSRLVRIHFTTGVEPCYVLDHVQVDYRKKAVLVTLFQGSDPQHPDAICDLSARLVAVDVKLSQPLRGRAIIDGAPATDGNVTSPPDADDPIPLDMPLSTR